MNIFGYEITKKKPVKKIIFTIQPYGNLITGISGDWGYTESLDIYPKIMQYYCKLTEKFPHAPVNGKVDILRIFFGNEYTFEVHGEEIDPEPDDEDYWEGR